jgi:hypothetical protein
LNRTELLRAREEKAVRADDLVQTLARGNNTRSLPVLRDIYLLGRDSAEYAGMVREIFRESGLSWEALVRRYAEEICRRLKTANALDAAVLEVALEEMGRERYEHWRLVRNIYDRSSKSSWNSLISQRAEQLARDLLDAQKQARTVRVNILETRIYEMVRDSPSSLKTVANIFETRTGRTWASLERAFK